MGSVFRGRDSFLLAVTSACSQVWYILLYQPQPGFAVLYGLADLPIDYSSNC